jgi:hypothetical protein
MSSSEAAFAWRMARTYGPRIVLFDRQQRIAWAQERIKTIEQNRADDWEQHKRECEDCQRGDLCLRAFSVSPTEREHLDTISQFRGMIYSEERDQDYANEAERHGVEYQHHIDGFCAYWQNVRYRKFVAVDWICERCRLKTSTMHAHHRHYYTLGFEEIDDLEALCADCHRVEHGR